MSTSKALHPFKTVTYTGQAPGTRFVVTAVVHGNEICGRQALLRLMDEIDRGDVVIARGCLTLVPVTNPLAFDKGVRNGDRNLNRAFGPAAIAREFEDHVGNWLAPVLAQHDVLLDLHSFNAQGQPFAMLGPRDNRGAAEPFALAAQEEALVQVLGVNRVVDGWLDTYVRGVARRRAEAGPSASTFDLNPNYGVGTTEYMRSRGGCALTLECGQHADPQAPEVAYQAVRRALAHLGLTNEAAPKPQAPAEALSLFEVVDKRDAADAFAQPWQSFHRLRQGDLIGTRADGSEVRATHDGVIMFPNAAAVARQEWFYYAKVSDRFT